MTRLRPRYSGVFFVLVLSARLVNAGQPSTSEGIDVIVDDAQGRAGDLVGVGVRFVPGPDDSAPGGPDEISSLSFTLEFAGLTLDSTDLDPSDGIPDAIVFNPDSVPELASFLLLTTPDQDRADFIIISAVPGGATLPSGRLLSIAFGVPAQATPGPVPLPLSNVSTKDVDDQAWPVDEAVAGVVAVLEQTTPLPSSTASPTRTSGSSTTPSPATPRSTPTASPPVTAASPVDTPTPTARRTQPPTRTPAPPTVPTDPDPCPPGFVCNVSSEDGGCALGSRSDTHWWPIVVCGAILVLRRRRVRR